MKNRIILFDLDLTLFNTTHFGYIRNKYISKTYDISLEKVVLYRNEYVESLGNPRDFNPKNFCKHICNSENKLKEVDPLEMYQKVFTQKSLYSNALYPDTIPCLERLEKDNNILGIFTEGVDFFQNNKITYSGIKKYLSKEHTFIFKNKQTKEAINSLPANCIIIEDKPEVITLIKQTRKEISTYLLNRSTHSDKPDEINSLNVLCF